jgi:CBS domain-containing protein
MTTAQDIIQTDIPKIDVHSTVSDLIGLFRKTKKHYALTYDGKKYLGIVEKRFLLTSRIDPSQMKITNIIKKRSKNKTPFYVPIITPDTNIKKIALLMVESDSHVLPVQKNNQIIGTVHAKDIVTEIANEYKNTRCDEFSSKPITAKEKSTIEQAIVLLVRAGIDHLPIVDENNKIQGMVSLTDLFMMPNIWDIKAQKLPQAAQHQKGKKTGYSSIDKQKTTNLPITNCYSRKKLCCTPPETKIPQAIQKMNEEGVCSIVLMKNNQPVGIFTMKDILKDYCK